MTKYERRDDGHSSLPYGRQLRNPHETDPSLTPYRFCDSCSYKVPASHSASLFEALDSFKEHNVKSHNGHAHLVKQR